MAAEIKDLQEKKQKIEISESELNIALEDSKKISLELNKKLSENMANNKKSEERLHFSAAETIGGDRTASWSIRSPEREEQKCNK